MGSLRGNHVGSSSEGQSRELPPDTPLVIGSPHVRMEGQGPLARPTEKRRSLFPGSSLPVTWPPSPSHRICPTLLDISTAVTLKWSPLIPGLPSSLLSCPGLKVPPWAGVWEGGQGWTPGLLTTSHWGVGLSRRVSAFRVFSCLGHFLFFNTFPNSAKQEKRKLVKLLRAGRVGVGRTHLGKGQRQGWGPLYPHPPTFPLPSQPG